MSYGCWVSGHFGLVGLRVLFLFMGLGLVGTPMYTACVLRGALHFFNKVFLLLIKKKKKLFCTL
jgi:hypothetical protein